MDVVDRNERVEAAFRDIENLYPTNILELQDAEATRQAGENLLRGRVTQRQVQEAQDTTQATSAPLPRRSSTAPPKTVTSYPIVKDPWLEHGTSLTPELASSEAISSGQTEAAMKYSMHQFPTSSDETRVGEMEEQGYNTSSLQLSVFVANMGNLARPSVISGKRINPQDI